MIGVLKSRLAGVEARDVVMNTAGSVRLKAEGTCKPGQTAAQTDCTPASDLGSGSGSGTETTTDTEEDLHPFVAQARKIIRETQERWNYPADKVTFESGPQQKFERGGVTWSKAGECTLKSGEITMWDEAIARMPEDKVRGIMAHEMMHGQYEAVWDQYEQERKAVNDRVMAGEDLIRASGRLLPEYEREYPVYNALFPHWEGDDLKHGMGALVKDDGVSEYSRAYWRDYQERKCTLHIAVHETLAEIARANEETGTVPGSKIWRDFYKAVRKEHPFVSGSKKRRKAISPAESGSDEGQFSDHVLYLDANFRPVPVEQAVMVRWWNKDGTTGLAVVSKPSDSSSEKEEGHANPSGTSATLLKSRLPSVTKALDPTAAVQDHVPSLAVDLDGTIAEYRSDLDLSQTEPREGAREALERLQEAGVRILVWTARNDLGNVRSWLDEHDIPYDAINQNPDFETGSRKLTADVFVDDRAISADDADWSELTREVLYKLFGRVRQPREDYDGLEELAEEAVPELTRLLTQASGYTVLFLAELRLGELEAELAQPGGKIVLAPVKAFKRAKEKVDADYDGDFSRLLDMVRAAVVVDTLPEVYAAVDAVQAAGGRYARAPKDRFKEPLSTGYRDYLVNLRLPCGMIVEVQFHVKPILIAREHEKLAYDVIRAIKASMEEEGREQMTPGESEACRRARKASRHLYARAWDEVRGKGGKEEKSFGATTFGILKSLSTVSWSPPSPLLQKTIPSQLKAGWVTIGGGPCGGEGGSHCGGTPVQLDTAGNVTAGPARLTGHPVNRLPSSKKPPPQESSKPKPAAQPSQPQKPVAAQPRTLANHTEANAYARQTHGEWVKKLKPKEKEALGFYGGPQYSVINTVLRTESSPAVASAISGGQVSAEKYQKTVQAMDEAIRKAPPLKEPMQVYRGIGGGSGIAKQLVPGAEIEDKAFVSTSGVRSKSEEFAGDALLEITLPVGTKAAAMAANPGWAGEAEWILPRGAKFRVVSREMDPQRSVPIIKVEYVQ